MVGDLVLTPAEVAAMLRVSEVTVRRMVRNGHLRRLPGVRVLLIPRMAVESLLAGEYDARCDGPGEGAGHGRQMVTDPGAAQMAEWLAAWERSGIKGGVEGDDPYATVEKGSNTYVPRELSDSTPVHMDDYMAGYRQGQADGLDEERLARALRPYQYDGGIAPMIGWAGTADEMAARVSKAYREDEG